MKKEATYNWKMVFFLTLLPLVGIFGSSIYVYFNGVAWQEPLLLLIFWFISGMGITMGYHRLFSHRSYDTNVFLEWILMICGSLLGVNIRVASPKGFEPLSEMMNKSLELSKANAKIEIFNK